MSREKSVIVKKRMKELQISEQQLARYVMRPVKDISAWLRGYKELPWVDVWKICDLLEAL